MSRCLDQLLEEIAACRICRDTTKRKPLAHEPRPVLRVSSSARIAICGQAPGTRVHASGKPFTDPSGDRLRDWMGVDEDTFYDTSRIAIIPMGFCFPGLDAKGGDLPPRPECALEWRHRVMNQLPELRLILAVGGYAIKWHLGSRAKGRLTDTVAQWRDYTICGVADGCPQSTRIFPLPHPSWRNNAWLKRNEWFSSDLLPDLRAMIAQELETY
jgi:uracil-DNA glycosylase